MKYGYKFKQLREDRDLSQAKVAEIIGTTQQQIYKYENDIQEMTGSRLKQLCIYYNVSADYILGLPRGLQWPR